LWLHSLKVAQLLRSAACLHTNQSRSYLNHLVFEAFKTFIHVIKNWICGSDNQNEILVFLGGVAEFFFVILVYNTES